MVLKNSQDEYFKSVTANCEEKNLYDKFLEKLAEVIQIKQLLSDGKLTQKTIGSQFNISRSTVKSIKSGRRWSYLLGMSAA